MFSLLAVVVTVLVLGTAMLWRGLSALARSRAGSRVIGRARLRQGASLLRPPVRRAALLTANPASGSDSSASSTRRRWR